MPASAHWSAQPLALKGSWRAGLPWACEGLLPLRVAEPSGATLAVAVAAGSEVPLGGLSGAAAGRAGGGAHGPAEAAGKGGKGGVDAVYSGSVLEGQRTGQAELRFANGESVAGEWVGDACVSGGRAKRYYPGGATYEGGWLRGKRHGHGRLVRRVPDADADAAAPPADAAGAANCGLQV